MLQETKLCPFCGEEIKSIAIKCKHCGSMLNDAPTTGPTSISNPETLIRQALGDRYELNEVVGRGGMATVYRAVQKNLNRVVALKVIHQNLVHDTEFVSRFIREAQLSASLSHPNIVTVYDVGSVGSVHYMAMEFLEGHDLHQMVKQKGAPVHEQVIGWLAPVAQALHYIHQKGLVHRDIKSSNIIITREGRPVLMDFGIAHAADGTRLTQTGTVIGTPEYMSPEQAQGKLVDHRSDLYSLGVVMYECLTGKVPFKGDNPLTTIHQVIYDVPQNPTFLNYRLPNWLESVVLKLLEKEKHQRFSNGNELVTSLIINEKNIEKTVVINRPAANKNIFHERDEIFKKIPVVKLDGGVFLMGNNYPGQDEYPAHAVQVDTFYISKFLVTQKLWEDFMHFNPSLFKHPFNPVEQVNWYDANMFIEKLRDSTGIKFKLPTEAQWEYAVSLGKSTPADSPSETDIQSMLITGGINIINSLTKIRKPHPVGDNAPNEFGIYDLVGNVWEWCSDWYDKNYYIVSPKDNPEGPSYGKNKAIRGAGWTATSLQGRVSYRSFENPSSKRSDIGFRLVIQSKSRKS